MAYCKVCNQVGKHQLPNGNFVCEKHFEEYNLFKKAGVLESSFKLTPFKSLSKDEQWKIRKDLFDKKGLKIKRR